MKRAEVLDVLGNFCSIDADALISHLLPMTDWEKGGEFIHMVEMVERFLQILLFLKTKVRVCFVEEGNFLWKDCWSKLLFKRVLYLHLKTKVKGVQVEKFSSYSEAERIFRGVDWLLLKDVLKSGNDGPLETEYFGGLILKLRRFTNVVLLGNELEFRSNDVYSWIVSKKDGTPEEEEKKSLWTGFQIDVETKKDDRSTEQKVKDISEKLSRPVISECFLRCKSLSLSHRLVECKQRDEALIKDIEKFCQEIYPLADAEMIDLIDGRLLHAMADGTFVDVEASDEAPKVKAVKDNKSPYVETHYHNKVLISDQRAEKWKKAKKKGNAPKKNANPPQNSSYISETYVSRGDREYLVDQSEKWSEKKEEKRKDRAEKRVGSVEQRLAQSMVGKYVQRQTIVVEKKGKKEKKSQNPLKNNNNNKKKDQNKKGNKKGVKVVKKVVDSEAAVVKFRAWRKLHASDSLEKALSHLEDEKIEAEVKGEVVRQVLILEENPKEKKDFLRLMMKYLELVDSVPSPDSELGPLCKKFGYEALAEFVEGNTSDVSVDEKFVRDQMNIWPELLPREKGKADERVRHFSPDKWQKKLLDCVDNSTSALVVAPTSSGKTFIQYYCMEKVLRESEDGIVVYVCPAKALVNQVKAGVTARFDRSSSKPISGIFTRDRRENWDDCQILVTVPQCLDILMLAPSKEAESWRKNVRWVIFDEVHCINLPEEGTVWERLLQMIRCPFLALSATISNPTEFGQWLSKIKGKPVEVIEHKQRYNDLRLSYATQQGSEQIMKPIHPLAFAGSYLEVNEIFPDFSEMESSHAIQLYEKMKVKLGKSVVENLDPCQFFESQLVTRQRAKEWAAQLKGVLVERVKEDKRPVVELLQEFSSSVQREDLFTRKTSSNKNYGGLFDCVKQLWNNGPVLGFCFVRDHTESMVEFFVNVVTREEEMKRIKRIRQSKLGKEKEKEKDKEDFLELEKGMKEVSDRLKYGEFSVKEKEELEGRWTELMGKAAELGVYEEKQEEKKSLERQKKKQESIKKEDPMDSSLSNADDTIQPLKVNDAGFRYAGIGDEEMRDEAIKELKWKLKWGDDHPLIRGLRLGIACHHSGMPHKYRVWVEVLFRMKDVTVLFSTTTLAQGIQAPARSVVLCYDSLFLTPTSFRQIVGRAGRRGFDDIGDVLFFGISYERIRSLLLSKVPELRGRFPLTPSLCLRFELMKKRLPSEKHVYLPSETLLTNQYAHSEKTLVHYQKYAKKLLQCLGVLDGGSEAVGLAGVIAHLSWMDPVPLALVYCLSNKLFEPVMEKKEDLLLYIASIVMTIAVHPSEKERLKKNAKSCVVVQEVPNAVKEMLRNYNKMVLDVFVEYSSNVPELQSCCLPLSEIQIGSVKEVKLSTACSVFARTSGVSNASLTSLNSLFHYLRGDLAMNHSCFPLVSIRDEINSYAVDFYKQEKVDVGVIIRDCELSSGWHLLYGFSMALRALAVAFATAVEKKDLEGNLFILVQEAEKAEKHDQQVSSDDSELLGDDFKDLSEEIKLSRILQQLAMKFHKKLRKDWL